jgi:hypothetical protein
MYSRPLLMNTVTATTQFFGSSAGGVLAAATNPARAFLSLQGLTDALRVSPIGSVNGSSPLIASQTTYVAPAGYVGAIYLSPNAGATAPAWLDVGAGPHGEVGELRDQVGVRSPRHLQRDGSRSPCPATPPRQPPLLQEGIASSGRSARRNGLPLRWPWWPGRRIERPEAI